MGKIIDITGQRFGRLLVLSYAETKGRFAYWLSSCDCGTQLAICGAKLRNGHTRSCGCLQKEAVTKRNHSYVGKHGEAAKRTPEYRVWSDLRGRCNNPKNKKYKDYGGRGIKVCGRWGIYANFLADMGRRPPSCDIHRVNNDGDYEPGNCVWLPHSEHMRLHANQRRVNAR
jgi:hypothetical protein